MTRTRVPPRDHVTRSVLQRRALSSTFSYLATVRIRRASQTAARGRLPRASILPLSTRLSHQLQ